MTDDRRGGPAAEEFQQARFQWIKARVQDLAAIQETTASSLYELLPVDLGDRPTAAAVALLRIAADDARARSVAETVAWLERLIHEGYRHDLTADVLQVRSLAARSGESALWAWNAQDWEELLLWWWRRLQPRIGDSAQDSEIWRARWCADVPSNGDIDAPERAPGRHGRTLLTLSAFFDREPEPLRLLAQAALRAPRTVAAIEDAVLLREEHLQSAGHLRWLAEQHACVEQLDAWRREHQKTGTEATRAFLAELSEAVKRYLMLVLQPVIDALSACERVLLRDSRPGARRTATDYLETFLEWHEQPDMDAWHEESVGKELSREASDRREWNETTWHGMLGTVPVWYHIVGSSQERAAALAYSGRPSASVIRVRTGEAESSPSFDLCGDGVWGQDAEEADWYPEPGIVVDYESHDATGLCVLLAVAQLGHARVEFLTPRSDGSLDRLRTVRAQVSNDDADAWRRWALNSLAKLAPDPEDLADLLTGSGEDEKGPRDEFGKETPRPGADQGLIKFREGRGC